MPSLIEMHFKFENPIYFAAGFRGGQGQLGLEITASVWASDQLMLQQETVFSVQQKTPFWKGKLKVLYYNIYLADSGSFLDF